MKVEEFIFHILSADNPEEQKWGNLLRESQKFNMGDYDRLPKLNTIEKVLPYIGNCPQAFNLPFPNILFFTPGSFFFHAMLSIEEPNVIETRFALYAKKEDRIYYNPIVGLIDFVGDRLAAEPFLGAEERSKQKQLAELSFHYCLLASYLAIINSENVITIDHLPAERAVTLGATEEDRRLFIYKTLHIKPRQVVHRSTKRETEEHDPKNSPRVHLRRGHLRRLPGKIAWVQPAVVGKVKKGITMKDYNVQTD